MNDDDFAPSEYDDFDPSEYVGDSYEDWTLTDQQAHDVMACRRPVKVQAGSKKRLVKLLQQKDLQQQESNRKREMDPIESVMANHPGITREEVVEMSIALGF